ncbi:DUF2780 domain-containing protein [Parvularcula lutaonensis]|uniref:DUF2780 domain-containing protein n=1 Tax=Parvularcula lutaonensis TaxID=491923 RepID=A0ABV7MB68_9PROT|nr:DUF2780 domain-containing protein [Parvularcula lutaonensis]GGY46162.1 hypothetical protein GCM10007148_14080 [Parvularcula lutaonensis]
MIDQLVKLVAQRLGIAEATAEQGVGVLLGLLKDQAAGQPALNELFAKVPGAEALADQFPAAGENPTPKGGGLMGGLMGAAAGALGGKAGEALSAMSAFQKTGLSMGQAQEMMPVVKDFMAENLGESTVRELIGSVPALKGFLE